MCKEERGGGSNIGGKGGMCGKGRLRERNRKYVEERRDIWGEEEGRGRLGGSIYGERGRIGRRRLVSGGQ
jgi:hypothetical protein